MYQPVTPLTAVGGLQPHNSLTDRAHRNTMELLQDAMGTKYSLLFCALFAGLSSNFLRRSHMGQLHGTAQLAIMPVACSRYHRSLRQQLMRVLV